MRASDADAPQIFADGATEMAMELAADLDGMPSGTTGEFREGETRVFLFLQQFSDARQPGRNEAPALRRVLPVGEQELQDDCFDVQPRKVIFLPEFAVKSGAESSGRRPRELAG